MGNNKKHTVAILATDFIKWGGGIDFIRLCLFGMYSPLNQARYNVKVLLPKRTGWYFNLYLVLSSGKGMLKQIIKGKRPKILKPTRIDYYLIEESFKQVNEKLEIYYFQNTQRGLITKLKEIRADIVLPSIQNLGKDFPFSWIGYLFDFQHKYYPDFFALKTCKDRDYAFEEMLTNASSIIVNARDVKKDIAIYFPDSLSKIFCLPFTPITLTEHLKDNNENEIELNIPPRYFIICNQFWIHKDHQTAFKAYKLFLNDSVEKDVYLVCTGKTYDERFPDLFDDLKKYLQREGILDKVIFTDYVPKVTQIKLLRNAIALVQPTLFEGGPGGFAVYEALAYGTRAIVSDIPVNKEINNYEVDFFKAGSEHDLAAKMFFVIANPKQKVEKFKLQAKTEENISDLGELLHEAIAYTLSINKPIAIF